MGFRSGAYATVWEIQPMSDTFTKGRISITRKNKDTGEYETQFSGFVMFAGTGAASKAAKLKEKDRIKLGDTDVTTKYNKEKNVTYTNFKIYDFEMADFQNENRGTMPAHDLGYEGNSDDMDSSNLPF